MVLVAVHPAAAIERNIFPALVAYAVAVPVCTGWTTQVFPDLLFPRRCFVFVVAVAPAAAVVVVVLSRCCDGIFYYC